MTTKTYSPTIGLLVKEYLGDSVYLAYDGLNYILTTENGPASDSESQIWLDPSVLKNIQFVAKHLEQVYVEEIG